MRKANKLSFIFGLTCALFACDAAFSQQDKLPESAQKILKQMPGQTLTPEHVVAIGMKNSSSFKRILANYPATEIPLLQQEAVYDWYLSGQVAYMENFKEQSTNTLPSFPYTTQYNLGISKAFSSGSSISAGWTLGNQRLQFIGMPEIKYKESEFKLEMAQSLWKNFLGNASRKELEAASLQSESAKIEILNQAEQWVLSLVGLYFQAWIAQKNSKSALDNLQRKKRLLRSTLAKYRRGTAEKPEKLQIESGVKMANTDYLQKNQLLHDSWHALVVSLDLPRDLLNLDPAKIPMKMPVELNSQICHEFKIPEESLAAQKAKLDAKAAKLLLEASKNNTGPELTAFGNLSNNGIENDYSSAIKESIQLDHLEWSIGLKFQVPLGFKADTAAMRASISQQKNAEAMALNQSEQLEIEYRNACEQADTLLSTKKILQQAVKSQHLRARLEQERFDLGRSSMFNVIQASDDAASAELTLRQIESTIQVTHWTLEKLSGQLSKDIKEKLEQR